MGKINRKTFWMECYSLKRYVNCVSPQRKNTPPLWIDTFAPSSYKHRVVSSSFEFQQKLGTVWNYQLQSKKLQTYWHRLFFNLFVATNWRLCVSKLLVLVPPHLAVVRGLLAKTFLPKCINEKSSTEHRS